MRRGALGKALGTDRRARAAGGGARTVCIASGKGGTGKTVLATNLATLRQRRGERVLLIDFDAGLANAHLLLGLAAGPRPRPLARAAACHAHGVLVRRARRASSCSPGASGATRWPTRRGASSSACSARCVPARAGLRPDRDRPRRGHLATAPSPTWPPTSTLILVTNHEVTGALRRLRDLQARADGQPAHPRRRGDQPRAGRGHRLRGLGALPGSACSASSGRRPS